MRSAFSLLLILFAVQIVSAQEDSPDNPLFPKPRPKRFFIGPMVGYNSNFHGGNFASLGGAGLDEACGVFTSGSGNGILAGLAGEYWFKPGGPTALQFRVYYEQKPGTLVTTPAPYPLVDSNGVLHYFNRTNTAVAVYNLLNLEVQYKYNFPGTRFGVAVGPKVGLAMGSSSYYQYETVTGTNPAENFQFNNGTNKLDLVPVGAIPGLNGIRFALVAHIQYEFLLGPFLVTPRILWDQGITKIATSWYVNSLAGTIEIKYGF